MPATQKIDLAKHIYAYLRVWWGLVGPLTDKKCELFARSVTKWRSCFRLGKYKTLRRMYRSDSEIPGYLTAFGPRYAYTLYFLLQQCPKRPSICTKGATLSVCYVGGGSAVDLIGLLAYLEERDRIPRDLLVHFIDQSPQWRQFHNALFASIIPKYFKKTRVLPHYHDLDLCAPAPNCSPSMSGAFDADVFILSNVLSEFSERERKMMKEHLRFLFRGARRKFYLLVADSNAPKLRPRVKWVASFVDDLKFSHACLFEGEYGVDCDWLKSGTITTKIFSPGGPSFLTHVKRRGFVARVTAG